MVARTIIKASALRWVAPTLIGAVLALGAHWLWINHQLKNARAELQEQAALIKGFNDERERNTRAARAEVAALRAAHDELRAARERLAHAPTPEHRAWNEQPLPEAVLREFGR